jgi:hypothetical protein
VQTFLKTVIIMLLGIVVALILHDVVDARFSMSMGPGGMSPGFAWLLKMRAAENGGQIAPSFEELGMSGGALGMGGLSQGFPGAPGIDAERSPLTDGLDLSNAPRVALRDAGRPLLACAAAVVLEVILTQVLRVTGRSRHQQQ